MARTGILVPVDGSGASRRAVAHAVDFARRLKAELVALHVVTPFELTVHANPRPAIVRPDDFARRAAAISERILGGARKAAVAARVPCRTITSWDTTVADAIIGAARRERCGLIVMASHGHTGLQRMLLGSVTQKVLAKSRIPVLVCP